VHVTASVLLMRGHIIKNFREKVLAVKEQISEKEFFTSPSATTYFTNLVEAVCEIYNCKLKMHLAYSDNGKIAWASDRQEIFLNINNEFFHKGKDRVEKLVALKGIALHECGHVLFTDYHLLKSSIKVLSEQKKLFPAPKCPEYETFMTDFVCRSDKEMKDWLDIYHKLSNTIEDGFIEKMVMYCVPGEKRCLELVRSLQYEGFESIKVQKSKGYEQSAILFNAILSLAKFNSIKMDADDKEMDAIKELMKLADTIKDATETKKAYNRQLLINTIFCKLYAFFKEEEEKEQQEQKESSENEEKSENGSSDDENSSTEGSSSGENSPSDDNSSDEISSDNSSSTPENNNSSEDEGNSSDNSKSSLEQMRDNCPDMPREDIDTGCGSVLNDMNASQDAQDLPTMAKPDDISSDENNFSEESYVCSQIENDIAEEKVMEVAEEELKKELEEEANNFKPNMFNNNASITVKREYPSKKSYEIYDNDMEEIGFLAKKTVSEIKNKIKDRQQGGKLNGLYMGRYLDQHSLGRFDMRMLCKNDLPEDIPNMSICVFIDCSGSMNGLNLVKARQMALLLYQFGMQLNIPVMVYGHNCDISSRVTMQSLADFGSVDGNDKYRICDISAHNYNRDGIALRFCSEKLAKRPEETKLMFVISDGLPSAYNSQRDAEADIRGVLMDFTKQGLKYITVGLGNERERIEHLYTQDLSPKVAARFISVDYPEKLPEMIVRTIKEIIK